MMETRIVRLVEKLERGKLKTLEILGNLKDGQWQQIVYQQPAWQIRDLLAHFVYSEEQLLALYQSIVKDGPGAKEGIDIDRYNAEEQKKLEGIKPFFLLERLKQARNETIAWVRSLSEEQLDKVGRHPVLGEINVEIMIEAIYGHQLLHMRDLARFLHGGE